MVAGENKKCSRCRAPRWIHGRSYWFCDQFLDPDLPDPVYDQWGTQINPNYHP